MNRPLPVATAETQPFWDGCATGEIRYQVCRHCGAVQLIPRALCAACHETDLGWKVSAGLGTLLTYTTVYRAPTPEFANESPYVIAIIGMKEGFRLMANVKDGASQKLAVGQALRIGFRTIDGATLPQVEVIA